MEPQIPTQAVHQTYLTQAQPALALSSSWEKVPAQGKGKTHTLKRASSRQTQQLGLRPNLGSGLIVTEQRGSPASHRIPALASPSPVSLTTVEIVVSIPCGKM